MQMLPVFFFQTAVVLVDDDLLFSKTLASKLSDLYKVNVFNQTQQCLNFLRDQSQQMKTNDFLKGFVEHELYGSVDHVPIDFDLRQLAALSENQEKDAEVGIILADYLMENMNGIELCQKLNGWPVKRILLTGEADLHQAVHAFNDNAIDCYIRKDESNLIETIKTHIDVLMRKYFIDKTKGLLQYLEADHQLPLSDSIFINFFTGWCQENSIIEYYLIDKNGSFFGRDLNKNQYYLIVHTDTTLNEFIELYPEEDFGDKIQAVHEKKVIPFFGAGVNPLNVEPSDFLRCFYEPVVLDGREKYYIASVKN